MKPYYSDEAVTIYHGDCREVLPSCLDVGVVMTDPPYGINHLSQYTCDTTTAPWMDIPIEGDGTTELRDFIWQWAYGSNVPIACFGSWKVVPPLYRKAVLIWDKGPASGMGDLSFPWKNSFEEIYIAGDGWRGSRDEGVIKGHWIVTRASMGRTHPNEKPVSLCTYLLDKSPEGLILDPFMGSGTTLRAAKDLGRKAIGIEIEERYCEIAAKRMSQSVMQFGAGK